VFGTKFLILATSEQIDIDRGGGVGGYVGVNQLASRGMLHRKISLVCNPLNNFLEIHPPVLK
jgi:hypothetical protein